MIFENKYKKLMVQHWTPRMRQKLIELIQYFGDGDIYVVGSRIMGFHTDESDLDIIVVGEDVDNVFTDFKGIQTNIKYRKTKDFPVVFNNIHWILPQYDLKRNVVLQPMTKAETERYYKVANRAKKIIVNGEPKEFEELSHSQRVYVDLMQNRPKIIAKVEK